eukprot:1061615-Rhodomonas_salina.5
MRVRSGGFSTRVLLDTLHGHHVALQLRKRPARTPVDVSKPKPRTQDRADVSTAKATAPRPSGTENAHQEQRVAQRSDNSSSTHARAHTCRETRLCEPDHEVEGAGDGERVGDAEADQPRGVGVVAVAHDRKQRRAPDRRVPDELQPDPKPDAHPQRGAAASSVRVCLKQRGAVV